MGPKNTLGGAYAPPTGLVKVRQTVSSFIPSAITPSFLYGLSQQIMKKH